MFVLTHARIFQKSYVLLLQHMLRWIESIARDLEKTNKKTKLVSAVCLASCLPKIAIASVKPEFALRILPLLSCTVENRGSTWPEYAYLEDILPANYR